MYGPEVRRLGGGREAHLPVVARVLVDLADDDPDVLRTERGHAGQVLVAVGDELEQPCRDARLDDADAHPVAVRDQPVALGLQLDRVARVDLRQLLRIGQVQEVGEAGLAGLLDEDPNGRLRALLGRHGLLARRDEERPQPVDVALGDTVGRVEGERRLIVLAGRAELTLLPEGLGEPVLGIGLGAHLEKLAVRVGGIRPQPGRGLGDRLLGQLALDARCGSGAGGSRIGLGEGHWVRSFRGSRMHIRRRSGRWSPDLEGDAL